MNMENQLVKAICIYCIPKINNKLVAYLTYADIKQTTCEISLIFFKSFCPICSSSESILPLLREHFVLQNLNCCLSVCPKSDYYCADYYIVDQY